MVTRLTRNTKVINYLGLPAISVPCGFTDNGLPIAFQLIGRPLAEAQLLSAAHRYEQEARWYEITPPLAQAA
jgi:aspartyl-tRNA(Asn)/glutamyl-tRNA(Gln) amidotransferase subunit A